MLVNLKNICTVITDGSHYSPLGLKSGYPMLSVKDMEEYGFNYLNCKFISKADYIMLVKNGCKPLKNDVLIAKDGSYLKEVFVVKEEKEEVILSSIAILRPNLNLVNPYYLAYYLKSNHIKDVVSSKYVTGSVLKRIILKNFENIEIDLPSLETQNKIASILLSIDGQIERNNTMVKRLQVMCQAIFNEWFIQFNYPDADGNLVYNDDLKRKIPANWTTYKLIDCIKWESSSQPPKSTFSTTYKKGYIRFIQNRDYDSSNHITFIPYKTTTKTCTRYDIMMDKYGDAGKIRCGLEGAYNVALAKITPTIEHSQEYIRQFLLLNSNYQYLHNACMASTRASLNETTLGGIIITIPTNDVLVKFETIMKNIMKYNFYILDATSKLQSLKEKLLPLLINQQLI